MRDPAVLAVFALRITADERASIEAGAPIVRPFWPLLVSAVSADGGAAWTFGPVTLYRHALPHHVLRGMARAHAGGPARDPHADAGLGRLRLTRFDEGPPAWKMSTCHLHSSDSPPTFSTLLPMSSAITAATTSR